MRSFYYRAKEGLFLTGIILVLITIHLGFPQVPDLPGTIAYFNNGTALHLAEADGSDNRVIWTNPTPVSPFFSGNIDWKPDGSELAFQSGHELLCSVYADDIWAIKPDGSGLRRITNAPQCSQLAGMPKGSVSVKVENTISNTSNIFFLYIDGADSAKSFVVLPGLFTTVTINGVSDFGAVNQRITVFNETNSWLHASGVDVQAGQTITASGQITLGQSPGRFTAEQPSWKRDGSEIAYLLSGGIPQVIDANPPWSAVGANLFPNGSTYASYHDWSPTSDDFLVTDALGSGLYLVEIGTGNAQLLVDQDVNNYTGLEWMPDGSGFVFGIYSQFNENANLFRYDFSSGNISQITNFTNEYAYDPTVSPDGEWVAYTRYAGGQNDPFEIWVSKMDGSDSWKLADDAGFAAWGPDVSTTSVTTSENPTIPNTTKLAQNYPNPFNPETNIEFELNSANRVVLKIFNITGQEVRTLVDGQKSAGRYNVRWNGRDNRGQKVPSGVYVYRLVTENGMSFSRKMMLVR